MHKMCCLFSLVRLLFIISGKQPWTLSQRGGKYVGTDRREEKKKITLQWVVLCLAATSHCLIWPPAATPLFSSVTFYGSSAPVPPIVPEFSIFGTKLDAAGCRGVGGWGVTVQ